MEVFFYSLDNQNNKVSFKSNAEYINNKLVFVDKSIESTVIQLSISSDKLVLERTGNTIMKLAFIENKSSEAYYKNEMGLEFDFIVKCNKLIITDNRIDIEYDMILDKELLSSHKIWIIMR